MQYEIIEWKKSGGTFADGNEANLDRTSAAPKEYFAAIYAVIGEMQIAGSFDGIEYHWQQDKETLTVVRRAPSIQAYKDMLVERNIDIGRHKDAILSRGWVFLGSFITNEAPTF